MFCSTIIPTVGRDTLSRAVESVLDQQLDSDGFEVIVVNDSGQPLPPMDWQESPLVQVIETNRRNRSVARNAGAAIARGRYLHFLDDDDWMLPGAFQSFWDLANTSPAAWLCGAFRMVDNAGSSIVEIFPKEVGNCFIQLVAWEWLPLQASLIESKAFFAVGGFASLQSLSGGFEDIDLSRQVARYYEMDHIPVIVASIRVGGEGSTTDYIGMFRQNRRSREKALSTPGAFARMLASARESILRPSYWHGKMIYYLVGSIRWNLQQRRLFAAISRSIFSAIGFMLASRHLFSADFWRGISKPHFSRVWLAIEKAGDNPYGGIEYDWS